MHTAEGAEFKPGSAEEKAKIYYESCLDRNDTVESRGTKPMQDLIESVSRIRERRVSMFCLRLVCDLASIYFAS